MKIVTSNKTCTSKPTGKNIGRYFGEKNSPNRIKFHTIDGSLDDLIRYIESGHTIGYQTKDGDNMNRRDNYLGTDYIIIDVDSTSLSIDEVVDRTVHQPTIIHTTFSNLTERKNNLYCYHLIYCLDKTLMGEERFYDAFSYFVGGIEDIYDTKAKDCNRITFTSHSSLPNYQLVCTNIIYNTDDIPYSLNENKAVAPKRSPSYRTQESFDIDKDFLNDLRTLTRFQFISKYMEVYPYRTSTHISIEEYQNGYADLRDKEYYTLPSERYQYNGEKREKLKVPKGHRDNMLFVDAISLMRISPNMQLEHLIHNLIYTVYRNYNNSDGEMTNDIIVYKAKYVFFNYSQLLFEPKSKMFKLDTMYWKGTETITAVHKVIEHMKEHDILSVYDFDQTIEENLKTMKEIGVSTTKRTIMKYMDKNGIEIKDNKQERDKLILKIIEDNPLSSNRQIATICQEQGIDVSYKTIQRLIKKVSQDQTKMFWDKKCCLNINYHSDDIVSEHFLSQKVDKKTKGKPQRKITKQFMKKLRTFADEMFCEYAKQFENDKRPTEYREIPSSLFELC